MGPEGFRKLVQGDAIGARGSAVRPDVLPSRFEIGLVDNLALLAPDVRAAFPADESVNEALRSMMHDAAAAP